MKSFRVWSSVMRHEILFDLTVKQHLLFFARLRYQSSDEDRSAVYETTKAIQLEGQLSKLPALHCATKWRDAPTPKLHKSDGGQAQAKAADDARFGGEAGRRAPWAGGR